MKAQYFVIYHWTCASDFFCVRSRQMSDQAAAEHSITLINEVNEESTRCTEMSSH